MHWMFKVNRLFRLRSKWVWLALFTLISTVCNAAHSTVELTPESGLYRLAPHLDILEEGDSVLSIDDILSKTYQELFSPLSERRSKYGFGDHAIWLKFTLKNPDSVYSDSSRYYLELDSSILDEITFYAPDKAGKYRSTVTGENYNLSSRHVSYRSFVFPIYFSGKETDTFYLRIASRGTIQLPLYVWSDSALIEHVDKSSFVLGAYFSYLFVLGLFSVIAWVKLRQKLFAFYVCYLASYAFLQLSLNGLGFQYFWADNPLLSSKANILSMSLAIVCGLLFCTEYLQINRKAFPRLYLFISGVYFVSLFGAFLVITDWFAAGARTLIACGMLLLPTIMLVAWLSYKRGVKRAKAFMVAWGIFLTGVFISGLHYLGVIPYNALTFYAMPIGSVFELTILGYFLGSSVEELKREKDQMSRRANYYLKQLNTKLDGLVDKRTEQLRKLNEDLARKATLDGMTGLLNHSSITELLEVNKQRALTLNEELSVLLIDIDSFKSINDTFGHLTGDQLIRKVAKLIRKTVRKSDYCGRYGGDEFLIILPETNEEDALKVAELLRRKVEIISVDELKGADISVSIGVASLQTEESNLIQEADSAMYSAKHTGKNRVALFPL